MNQPKSKKTRKNYNTSTDKLVTFAYRLQKALRMMPTLQDLREAMDMPEKTFFDRMNAEKAKEKTK